jgi:chaperonin cofactor prefoldin
VIQQLERVSKERDDLKSKLQEMTKTIDQFKKARENETFESQQKTGKLEIEIMSERQVVLHVLIII